MNDLSRNEFVKSTRNFLWRFGKFLVTVLMAVIGTIFNMRLVMGVGNFYSVFPTVIYNFNLFVVIVISLPFSLRKTLTFGLPGVKSKPTDEMNVEGEEMEDPVKHWDGLQVLRQTSASSLTNLTTPELIKLYEYPTESHRVETEDGYILTLHRIPFGRGQRAFPKKGRPVAFLQHGLFASSFEWFMNTPDKLLALQLVDTGYDVWLGNARGNVYSREHVTLSTKNREYWEFSVNEMGKFDLPAAIDFVLEKTGARTLRYIGFSMGNSMFWIMMSHRPEYNQKIRLMIGLAPVVYLNHMKGCPKILLAPFENQLKVMADFLFHGEFLPPWLLWIYNYIGTQLSTYAFTAESFCSNINFLYAGWDLPQNQIKQLPLFYSHTPSPTSAKTLAHIAQFINHDIFQEYDFGTTKNLQVYGQPSPLNYKLQNTTVPVALIWGLNDAVVEPMGVKRLASELPNVVVNQPVNFTLWNHFDYHLARDVNELVNEPILKILSNYR